MRRLLLTLIFGCLVGAVHAQDGPAGLIRLGFFPPVGEEIAYRIDYRHEHLVGDNRDISHWTHELRFTLSAPEADTMRGTFSVHAVTLREGGANDIALAMARAIENQTFDFTMGTFGLPVEVDWAAVQARVTSRISQVADPFLAQAVRSALPVFDADGVVAVMRPFWAMGVSYLRAFRRDGEKTVTADLDLPAWYQVDGSELEIYGGREEGSEDLFLVWKTTQDPERALTILGPQLRGLVATIARPEERDEVGGRVERALKDGLSVVEAGIATYDLTPGLMRKVDFHARIIAGDIRRDTSITITRLTPE